MPEDIKKIAAHTNDELKAYKAEIMVCTCTACVAAKSYELIDELNTIIEQKNLSGDFHVIASGCNGFCPVSPTVIIQPEGVFYQGVKETDLEEIVEKHLVGGEPVERLLHDDPINGKKIERKNDLRFFNKQKLIALRNQGLIDPEKIEHYIAHGGYKAIAKVLNENNPEGVIEEIVASGIRGRGGGGFPAGIKWHSGRKAAIERGEMPYIVCNADEGDPGAYMDRGIIETDPHTLIEGMLIGAFAVGAKEGYIYIRREYPLALIRLNKAIAQARELGLLGMNILDSDFSFDIYIHRGAGAFVCGESSALMKSMTGNPGEPRAKYVHNVEYGFRDKPTVLNNVETWANIPVIIDKGAGWFAAIGTGDVSENPWNGSSGTKVFSLVGDVNNAGLVEVPMGTTLREMIFDIGGGIPKDKKFKAVQTGGPSGGCLPESKLDLPIDFDTLTEAGSMMGSGGMIVMDEHTCMVDVAQYFIDFLVDESCGKCTPCREGLYIMSKILHRITAGEGKEGDIELLEELSDTIKEASLCQLGGSAPNPVLSTIKYFREEYEAHIYDKKCPAGVCKTLISYSINENCTGCTLCSKHCPVDAIIGTVKEIHEIDMEKCIRCGVCYEVCKFDAVEVK